MEEYPVGSKLTFMTERYIHPMNTLHELVDKDKCNLEEIKNFLVSNPSSINQGNYSEETPLLCVLRRKNCSLDVVQLLLAFGADVNQLVNSAYPPSCSTALDAILDEFLEMDCTNNPYLKPNPSTLCFAFCHGASKDVIELLLNAGCSLHACKEHFSILHCALDFSKSGPKRDIIRLLIERGVNVNNVDTTGRNLVCFAIKNHNDTCTIELLLAAGASLNDCSIHDSPLFCAVGGAGEGRRNMLKAELIKLILQSGAPVDVLNNVDQTPLEFALKKCDYETGAIRLLLGCLQGVNPNIVVDDISNTLLHVAVSNSHCKPKTVKLLINQGVQVNKKNENWETALHMAVRNTECKLGVIKILLKNKVEINKENLFGDTPLNIAVENWQDATILKELLVAGAMISTHHCSSLLEIITVSCNKSIIEPITQSLLRKISNECGISERNLTSFKMLLRYFFLQTSHFDIDDMLQHCENSKELLRFRHECEGELQKMKSENIGEDLTLHEFLSNVPTSPQVGEGCQLQEKNYDLFQLMKAIADNAYPLYYNLIKTKIDRTLIGKKLQEVEIYTVKYSIDLSSIEKKVILNYKSACSIAEYLSDDYLLKLILAFYDTNGHPCSGQASAEKSIENKRSVELTEESSKRPKLHE